MPFPTYDTTTDFTDGCAMRLLRDEVIALDISSATFIGVTLDVDGTITVDFETTPNAEDQAAVDAVVAAHSSLPVCKCEKHAEIDKRTMGLIEEGFTYADKTFSLSQAAQARLTGINQVRDNAALVYPITWNTIDDADTYDLVDSDAVLAFYLTALGTYRGHVDTGTALKDEVRAASDNAEVDAVVDTR